MHKVAGWPIRLNARATRPKNLSLLINSKLVSISELDLTFGQKIYLKGNKFGALCDKWVALKDFLLYKLERTGWFLKLLVYLRPNLVYVSDLEWRKLSEIEKNFYGFFQDEQIVLENWDDLTERVSNSALQFSDIIFDKTVIVHVRLTDYLVHPEIGSLNEEYYLRCLKHFSGLDVLIITDDAKTFHQRFPVLSSLGEIFQKSDDSFECFKMMSNAKNLIIANSTFSYWGGIFSIIKDPNCKVVSPSRWRADGEKNSILCSKFLFENASYF